MKVVADENIPFVKQAFAEFGDVVTVSGRDITRDLVKDATILLVRSITRVDEKLLGSTRVKFVGSATTGTDHVDHAYLEQNNIGFANAPGSNAESVAEYVIAALLYLSQKKQIPLENKTIGIVGAGNVGSRVFKKAQIFGMKCMLNDPPKQKATKSDLFCPLDELVRKADIITLHVPLTLEGEDATFHLINKRVISKMKQGVILINTSRGGVIEENALQDMATDALGGLVLDVWDNEPNINTDLLNSADIGTPHIAGYSYEGKVRGIGMVHDAACAFFFKERQWQEHAILSTFNGGTIDLAKSKNKVYDAVMQACPILADDEELRNMMKLTKVKKISYFDELRKKYRNRFEFTHFSVKADHAQPREKNMLGALGFTLI